MRAQVRPRRSQVPRPISGMRAPWASTTCLLREMRHCMRPHLPSALSRKAQQEQRPARGLAVVAERDHGRGHGALEKVPIECATSVARVDPGALHVAQFDLLLRIELVAQAAVGLVEDVVPDRVFAFGARHLLGRRFRVRLVGAGIGNDRRCSARAATRRPADLMQDCTAAESRASGLAVSHRLAVAASSSTAQCHARHVFAAQPGIALSSSVPFAARAAD